MKEWMGADLCGLVAPKTAGAALSTWDEEHGAPDGIIVLGGASGATNDAAERIIEATERALLVRSTHAKAPSVFIDKLDVGEVLRNLSHSVHARHQSRCTRHIVSVLRKGLNQDPFFVSHALKLEEAMQSEQQQCPWYKIL
jgi:hypothetical protein